jgi:hypothetical protein
VIIAIVAQGIKLGPLAGEVMLLLSMFGKTKVSCMEILFMRTDGSMLHNDRVLEKQIPILRKMTPK